MDDDRSDDTPRPGGSSGPPPGPTAPWDPGAWQPVPPWLADRYARGRSHAETALILGILGVVLLPVLAPFAIWQAREAEKLGVPATAGRVLGWVGTVLLGVFLLFLVLWLVAAAFLIGFGGGG
ncbi:hypothetical protein GCM10009696_28950 [Kocuria himachalensis]